MLSCLCSRKQPVLYASSPVLLLAIHVHGNIPTNVSGHFALVAFIARTFSTPRISFYTALLIRREVRSGPADFVQVRLARFHPHSRATR